MISPELQHKFNMMEHITFVLYLKASKKEGEELCKKLGEWEAKEIIKEAEIEAEKIILRTSKIS